MGPAARQSQPTGARIRGVPEWADGIRPADPLRRTPGAGLLPQSQPSTDRKAFQVRQPLTICIRLDAYGVPLTPLCNSLDALTPLRISRPLWSIEFLAGTAADHMRPVNPFFVVEGYEC
jgi:hypothetical protein